MEYCGHVFLHQLQEMPLRASQVRLQTTLQIPAIKDTLIFNQTPEIEVEKWRKLQCQKLTE